MLDQGCGRGMNSSESRKTVIFARSGYGTGFSPEAIAGLFGRQGELTL
jgi:hypothetical protein